MITDFVMNILPPAEMRSAAVLCLWVLAATELLKRLWRRVAWRFNYEDVWFISSAMGLVGAFKIWPESSTLPWWLIGLITSGLVSFVHKYMIIIIRWRAPALAELITGGRRRRHTGPPNGRERRRRAGDNGR